MGAANKGELRVEAHPLLNVDQNNLPPIPFDFSGLPPVSPSKLPPPPEPKLTDSVIRMLSSAETDKKESRESNGHLPEIIDMQASIYIPNSNGNANDGNKTGWVFPSQSNGHVSKIVNGKSNGHVENKSFPKFIKIEKFKQLITIRPARSELKATIETVLNEWALPKVKELQAQTEKVKQVIEDLNSSLIRLTDRLEMKDLETKDESTKTDETEVNASAVGMGNSMMKKVKAVTTNPNKDLMDYLNSLRNYVYEGSDKIQKIQRLEEVLECLNEVLLAEVNKAVEQFTNTTKQKRQSISIQETKNNQEVEVKLKAKKETNLRGTLSYLKDGVEYDLSTAALDSLSKNQKIRLLHEESIKKTFEQIQNDFNKIRGLKIKIESSAIKYEEKDLRELKSLSDSFRSVLDFIFKQSWKKAEEFLKPYNVDKN